MNWIDKLERKFGRYSISNLPAIMIGLYVAGYVLYYIEPRLLNYLTLEPYYILRGQVWRIITWVLIPPERFGLFTIIMLFFYFSLGKNLERTWGTFKFNLYIFSGILFTVLGAFILFFVYKLLGFGDVSVGPYFSTYYINMSIFLAFALNYPDMQVLLYFIIPVKMKWMGILYGVLILYSFMNSTWAGRVAIIASLLNFAIFFFSTRNLYHMRPGQIKRRRTYTQQVNRAAPSSGTRHKCAVCGRTEKDDPNLEFRYCSKCYGSYEYCQDHLFNHQHVQNPGE